jgi:hypothetical protein
MPRAVASRDIAFILAGLSGWKIGSGSGSGAGVIVRLCPSLNALAEGVPFVRSVTGSLFF